MMRAFDRFLAPMLLCIFWTGALPAGQANAADSGGADAQAGTILGNWLTQPHDGIIQISVAADGSYQGRIVGGNNPGRVDQRNPDPARRQQRLLGQIILQGMNYQGAGRWSGGTIYEPDSGRTYKCRLELQGAGRLKVHGFVGIALVGRSQVWTRYLGRSMVLPAP